MEFTTGLTTYLLGIAFAFAIGVAVWRFLKSRRAWAAKRHYRYSAGVKSSVGKPHAARPYETRSRVPLKRR